MYGYDHATENPRGRRFYASQISSGHFLLGLSARHLCLALTLPPSSLSRPPGVSMTWYNFAHHYALAASCAAKLTINAAVIKRWNELPNACDNNENCKKYYEFTRTFGTHIITQAYTGSKISVRPLRERARVSGCRLSNSFWVDEINQQLI